jgi:hypothetical protein
MKILWSKYLVQHKSEREELTFCACHSEELGDEESILF